MKNITHVLAASVATVAGLLCIPSVHALALGYAAHNPYAAIIVPALLGIAALYHNPKETPSA